MNVKDVGFFILVRSSPGAEVSFVLCSVDHPGAENPADPGIN